MHNNLNLDALTKFLNPQKIKIYDIKNNVNDCYNDVRRKNLICCYSFERWKNKKINSKFRTIITDQKKRYLFEKQELKNLIFKTMLTAEPKMLEKTKVNFNSIKHNNKTKFKTALGPVLLLDQSIRRGFLVTNGCVSKIRNRCILTARHTTIGKLGLSRIMLRKLAGFGKLPGLTKLISR